MALKKASDATPVDLDRIDLDALAKENAAVVISHRGYGEEKDYGQGVVKPVKARIIVLTGSEKGRVDEDGLIFKAGIRMKLGEPGDDTVGRLAVYGARKHAGLNDEQDGDLKLAEEALAAADKGEKVPAAVGGGSKGKGAEYDDSPDF